MLSLVVALWQLNVGPVVAHAGKRIADVAAKYQRSATLVSQSDLFAELCACRLKLSDLLVSYRPLARPHSIQAP